MTLARNLILVAALTMAVGGLWVASEPPPWWQFILAVGVATFAQLLRQRFRVNATVFYLAWGEAALIISFYLVPAGWVPAVIGTGFLASVGLRTLWTRLPPPPTASEVTACLTLAAGVGALAVLLIADPYRAPLSAPVTTALVIAAVGYLGVSTVTVNVMSQARRRAPLPPVMKRTLRYKLPMSAGSIAIGLTAVVLAHADWRWLLVLPTILWLLHWTYTYRVRSGERRRMWSALAAATRSLNRPDESAVAAAGARGALEVFAVGRAEVALESGNGHRRSWVADPSGEVRQLAQPLANGAGTAVPLLVGADQIGLLRLHFPDPDGPGDGDHAALQAYADALAAALHDTATHEELHRLLERSAHDAQHDPLTGLLNRNALLARGETAVQLVPHGSPVTLLLIDVDHFREINDTLGHAAGDEVLAVTAQRLREAAGPGEVLGRLGGDEFAMLVTGAAGNGSRRVPRQASGSAGRRAGRRADLQELQHWAVRRGRELIDQLAVEASINTVTVSIEASVGVVVEPAGTADMTELLRRAHAAMQQAKQGGGTVSWYDITRDDGSSDRPALLAELREALERDHELVLALQPVVELATGAPAGVEALVRWQHPQRGLLPPAEFVRAVENSDLLGMFTEYVIDKALAAAAAWARHGPPVPVAVNLSARSLLDPQLPSAVSSSLRKHRVPGHRLILEITETVVTSELPGVAEALTSLRALGVRLSVDDFGTGYASLSFLTRVPLDEVKLDGSFITRMAHSMEAAAIVRTTVELGRELGMRVVAEGVETAGQLELLAGLGCPAGQGFHLAMPTSQDRIADTLQRLSAAASGGAVVPMCREVQHGEQAR